MTKTAINQLGAVGLILDGDPSQLPDNAFTDAMNVRFNGREIETYAGNYQEPYYTTRVDGSTDLLTVQWIVQPLVYDGFSNGARVLVGAGMVENAGATAFGFVMQNMNVADFKQLPVAEGVDITGWPISGSPWVIQCGQINNSAFFTMPGQVPLAKGFDWTGVDTLPGWGEQTLGNDGTVSDVVTRTWHCKKMIAFDNRLIALNMTEETDGGALIPIPNRMRWSGFARENQFPHNWDDTGANRTSEDFAALVIDGYAGWQGITTQSQIVDACANGNTLYVYTERETFALTSSGNAQSPFVTKTVYSDLGCLDVGCVVNAHGYNYIFTGSDVVRHDAVSWKSIADGAVRDFIADFASSAAPGAVKLAGYPELSEIWVLMPAPQQESDDAGKSIALAYNYIKGTWSKKSLPYVITPVFAQVAPGTESLVWDAITVAWDEITQPWGTGEIKTAQGTLIAPGVFGGVHVLNAGPTEDRLIFDGESYSLQTQELTAHIEREGMMFNTGRAMITETILKGDGASVAAIATAAANFAGGQYIWESQDIDLIQTRRSTWRTEGGAHAWRLTVTGQQPIPAGIEFKVKGTGR